MVGINQFLMLDQLKRKVIIILEKKKEIKMKKSPLKVWSKMIKNNSIKCKSKITLRNIRKVIVNKIKRE